MAIVLGNVHACLKHYDTERYSRNPADKAYDAEDAEDGEHDARRIVVPNQVLKESWLTIFEPVS